MEKSLKNKYLRTHKYTHKYTSIHIERDTIPGIAEDYVKLFASANVILEFRVIRQSGLKVRCEIREAKAEEPVKTSRSLQRRASLSVSHNCRLWKFCGYSDINICWHETLRWLPHHRDSPVISETRSLSVKPDKLIPSQGPRGESVPSF